MRRRLNMLQAGVAAALVTLSGAAAASAQELVRIGLAVPHNAAYVQFYAAETLGFYKEAGVKAELTLYRGGAASQEALSAGAADIITLISAPASLLRSARAPRRRSSRRSIPRRMAGSSWCWRTLRSRASRISTARRLASLPRRHRGHVRALGRGQGG